MSSTPRMLAVFLAALVGLLAQAGAHASHIELAGRLDGAVADYGDWRAATATAELAGTLPEGPVEVIFVADTAALAASWNAPAFAAYGIAVDAATALPAAVPDAPQHTPSPPDGIGVLAVAVLAVALAGRGKRGQGPFDPR